jgi:hypothetical protein
MRLVTELARYMKVIMNSLKPSAVLETLVVNLIIAAS